MKGRPLGFDAWITGTPRVVRRELTAYLENNRIAAIQTRQPHSGHTAPHPWKSRFAIVLLPCLLRVLLRVCQGFCYRFARYSASVLLQGLLHFC